MSITLNQLRLKIKLFFNNRVWPFTTISDLKSKLDQAEYDRRIAVGDLVNYMRRDIRAADIQLYDNVDRRPVEVKVFTGYKHEAARTVSHNHSPYQVPDTHQVIVLDPLVLNFVDDRSYPNFDTRAEPAEQYRRLLAEHVSDFIYERIMEGKHNG